MKKQTMTPATMTPALMALATMTLLASAPALAMTDYVWDNAAGFQPTGNCSVLTADTVPFKIALKKTQLLGKSGKGLSVAQNTLVKTVAEGNEGAIKGMSSIIVVNSPSASNLVASRDDEGTVSTSSLQDLGDLVLALGSDSPAKEIGDSKIKLAGSFLQASIKDEQYQILNCIVQSKPRQYVLFDVFTADAAAPLARIAVSIDDTKILRSVRPMTPEDAEKSIAQQPAAAAQASTPRQQTVMNATSARTSAKADSKATTPVGQEPSFIESAISTITTTIKNTTGLTNNPNSVVVSAKPAALKPTKPAESAQTTASVPVIQGSLDYVVCSTQSTVQVKDTDLRKDLFKAKKLEKVVPVQSFGTDRQIFEGQTFQKVQFTDRNDEIGWLPSSVVVAESSCFNIDEAAEARKRASANTVSAGSLSGDQFPMAGRPVRSYKVAPLRFRSMRGGGRIHAACDLYRPHGEKVVAIGDGVVVRGKYYFYQGVYAIEVRHNGGFIARYGEVLGRSAPGVGTSARVKAGQTVGYVGTVNSGCCSPMMHFELYRGTTNGPLTQRHGGFERRSDLMDPTNYLSSWEKAKFGASY